jgi:hypothetical protein
MLLQTASLGLMCADRRTRRVASEMQDAEQPTEGGAHKSVAFCPVIALFPASVGQELAGPAASCSVALAWCDVIFIL